MRSWRFRACALLAVVAMAGIAAAAPAPTDPDPVQARAFEIRFRSATDAQALVAPILSADGSVTVQPKLRTLVVQDRVSVLDRVAGLLATFDLPPRNVEVTLSLFLGTDRREQEAGRNVPTESLSREVRGVSETLGDFTKWNAYQHLGGRSVTAVEGSEVKVDLSDDYRVVFEVDSIQDRPGSVVRFKSFTLQKIIRESDGREHTQDVYTTQIVIPAAKMLVVGAAQNPESKRALFLTLQAKPR